MALYSVESGRVDYDHSGEKTENGEIAVELSDSEVDILVRLIKENRTANVKYLYLEYFYPNLYKKLNKAYFKKAYKKKTIKWLLDLYKDGDINDCYGLMIYCEDNLGFSYEFEPEEYFNEADLYDYYEDPQSYEEEIDELKMDAFLGWLDEYLDSLSIDEAKDFFFNIISEGYDDDYVMYSVKIPSSIIRKARE